MAFKLTYIDGQEDDYDDDTKWALEDGVLKLGRGNGDWSVLVSPGHWATLELGQGAKQKKKDDKSAKDEKSDKDDKDKDDKDKEDKDDS